MVLDIKGLSDFADYFIICSADSDRGVKTIVENIEEELEEMGEKALGVEGYADSR